jgi:hypothetical protein
MDSPATSIFPPSLVYPDVDPKVLEEESRSDRGSVWPAFMFRVLALRATPAHTTAAFSVKTGITRSD